MRFTLFVEICHSKRDVVLVVDSSGSIRDNNPDDDSFDNWIILKGKCRQCSSSCPSLIVYHRSTGIKCLEKQM